MQIKTYSEAICETVGSMMKIHRGKGRNLHPVNFSKEIYLYFNLPPLHILSYKFIPKIVESKIQEKKKYFRKLDGSKLQYKIRYQTTSAAIGHFRRNQESSSHLPLDFVN